MKFVNLHLTNYIGIFNGMGLYDINIDFTKCKHRMTIIRGDNGSGKSTLSKAMNLFPDSSDNFIPGYEARKEITLADGATIYFIRFIHGVKTNGEREVTKAYIAKTFMGTVAELNENGNVTSYKDIIHSELGLDANFTALSQLSTDDRGLADKKPAERKRFVNSIISSLEVYNSIYKTLNKRSSNFKSMINALVAKLNILGDENVVASNLAAIEDKINHLTDMKDKYFADLARAQSAVQILDPDGSIQSTITTATSELELAENDHRRYQTIIDNLVIKSLPEGHDTDFAGALKKITDAKNSTIIQCTILRNKVETLLNQKDQQVTELTKKTSRLAQLNSGNSYESIKQGLQDCEVTLANIRMQLIQVGIEDPASISKDEYILALETLRDLNEYISVFKSTITSTEIATIVSVYIEYGEVPLINDIADVQATIKSIQRDLDIYKDRKRSLEAKFNLLDQLALRPKDCSINDCPFIREAIAFDNTDPIKEAEDLSIAITSAESTIAMHEKYIENSMSRNEAIARFNVIVREVTKNAKILSKLRNGDMFRDPRIFFEQLMNGYVFDYMQDIYRYIDLANQFDVYKIAMETRDRFKDELRAYESKESILDELQAEIAEIDAAVTAIANQIMPIRVQVEDLEKDIAVMTQLEGVYTSILENIEKQKPIKDKIAECRRILLENSRKINQIQSANNDASIASQEIARLANELDPLMKERDKLIHSTQLIKDYKQELKELQESFDFIETIKFYSSPTTGIQLVFMQLYMGKVIALANELLSYLFNGKFVIQPFVINETEFRIPCLGEGYLNDDISSMSSSQIGMISMILSFALLHHSSTKFNIIKLDEIDGPLDYNNRLYFMDVLNRIMDIMHTEQCIMISHNSELQVDNSDIILLRHDDSNMDYQRGNIIWSF